MQLNVILQSDLLELCAYMYPVEVFIWTLHSWNPDHISLRTGSQWGRKKWLASTDLNDLESEAVRVGKAPGEPKGSWGSPVWPWSLHLPNSSTLTKFSSVLVRSLFAGYVQQAFSQAAVQPSNGWPALRNGRFSTACFGPPFTNFCA